MSQDDRLTDFRHREAEGHDLEYGAIETRLVAISEPSKCSTTLEYLVGCLNSRITFSCLSRNQALVSIPRVIVMPTGLVKKVLQIPIIGFERQGKERKRRRSSTSRMRKSGSSLTPSTFVKLSLFAA